MRISFDQGTPVPLRRHLSGHTVSTAYEMGWSDLANGDLLAKAGSQFDLMMTTDQNLRYQQYLKGRKLAILVLPTTSWPEIQKRTSDVTSAVSGMKSGGYLSRKTDRLTPAGKLRFIRVPSAIYGKPAQRLVVSGEQALCDFAWLSLRDGIEPRSLVKLRNLDSLSPRRLKQMLRRYPGQVKNAAERITGVASKAPLSA